MEEVGERAAGHLIGGPAEHAGQGRAGESDAPFAVERQDDVRAVLQQHPEPLLPVAQGAGEASELGRHLLDRVGEHPELVRAHARAEAAQIPSRIAACRTSRRSARMARDRSRTSQATRHTSRNASTP